jgi:thioredoxin 1
MVMELTDSNFNEVISKGIVMIDFWAPWCGPCKMLSPVIDEIAKETSNVTITKVNVDDYPELAARMNVMSIPTLVFFKDGVLVDTSIGVVSKSTIVNKLSLI